MGHARHIGRVGTLAVALGIGSAVASPQIAFADGADHSVAGSSSESRSVSSPGSAKLTGPRTVRTAGVPRDSDVADDGAADTDAAPGDDVEPDAATDRTDTEGDPAEPVDDEADPVPDADDGGAEQAAPTTGAGRTDRVPATPRAATRTAPLSVIVAKTTTGRPAHAVADSETTVVPATGAAPAATSTAAAVAAEVPEVSIVVTPEPSLSQPSPRPLRQLVLGVLGLFGFNSNPAPGTTNNPILEGLWGAYRRIESALFNETPTVKSAEIIDRSLTEDGQLAVTLAVEFDDYDGDPLSYTTTDGTHGTLTRNLDGTYTYLTNPGTGTDTVSIIARDKGFHLHGLLGIFRPGGGHARTATLTLTIQSDDGVISTPGTGNSWTVGVENPGPDHRHLTLNVFEPKHVSVVQDAAGNYIVTVTDTDWALANPGTQIMATATVTTTNPDGEVETTTTTFAVGTVSNLIAPSRDIPALPAGMTWLDADSASWRTVLVRSDGNAFSVGGDGAYGPITIPDLPAGVTYTKVTAGDQHFVLLRSDGVAVAVAPEGNEDAARAIPELLPGLTYTQIAAGANHTVLLRSDGAVIAVGDAVAGETTIPDLPVGVIYTQISAAGYHTVLLRSDGTAVAFGNNDFGQSVLPDPPPGVTYTKVATGAHHTVFLHSDGTVSAVGYNSDGQTEIPALPAGLTYVGIDAGHYHTALLRSDGAVIVVGHHDAAPEAIPDLPDGVSYQSISANHGHTTLLFGRV